MTTERLKGRPRKGISVEPRKNYTLTVPNASYAIWLRQAEVLSSEIGKDRADLSAWISLNLGRVISGKVKVPYEDRKIPTGPADDFRFKFQFSVRESELKEWRKFAQKSGLKLAEWIRQSLDFISGNV